MDLACLDFEGILVPEVWINVAELTGIEKLRVTTRDIPDYDALMRQRLRILQEHHLGLPDIQRIIAKMVPLEGAENFLGWLRERYQVILLSDTFYEFAAPLLCQLGQPVILCHHLDIAEDGRIAGYHLRQKDSKRKAVRAFRDLNFRVIAVGDSYNDTTMLAEADAGILFRPPDNVKVEFPQFRVALDYGELRREFLDASGDSSQMKGRADDKLMNEVVKGLTG